MTRYDLTHVGRYDLAHVVRYNPTHVPKYDPAHVVRKKKRKRRRRIGGEVPRTALAATALGGRPRAVVARAALAPSSPMLP
ncbi:hypothetical protein GW17_00025205 [Ensete ventricosum]|nr:hypothetical protein GW17_00025205 [Ensete ventricosum]